MTQRYWNRVASDGTWLMRDLRTGRPLGPPPGEDLAAMRAGLGREPGTVPAMWRFYTCEVNDRLALRNEMSIEQRAEHAALSFYGMHQQSKSTSMHRPGHRLGKALQHLRSNKRFSEQAVDARVNAAATSASPNALLIRLRGLIDQLRVIDQPLDYDHLMQLIQDWHNSEGRRRARRGWAVDYQVWTQKPQDDQAPAAS